jgi:hypothetical protein
MPERISEAILAWVVMILLSLNWYELLLICLECSNWSSVGRSGCVVLQ